MMLVCLLIISHHLSDELYGCFFVDVVAVVEFFFQQEVLRRVGYGGRVLGGGDGGLGGG